MAKYTKFALMLGGNLGNTEDFFHQAVEKLAAAGCGELKMSRIFRTAPVDCVPGTPDFLNAALVGEWPGSAPELLAVCQKLEREAGRPEKHSSRESRTLDLDLILFGGELHDSPRLVIPHPRARQRRFVLEPLCELIPGERFPDTGEKIEECLKKLSAED